jgi:hypothetical protein
VHRACNLCHFEIHEQPPVAFFSMAPLFFDIPQGYKRSCAEKHAFRRLTRGLVGLRSITLTRAGGNRGRDNSMKDGHQYRTPDFLTLSMLSNIKELTSLQLPFVGWTCQTIVASGRTTISFTSTSFGCSIAYWMARPMASGWIAILR